MLLKSFHTDIQFILGSFRKNGRLVKKIECLSIWLYLRGFKSHLRYASNSLYGEMVSSMDFKFNVPSLMLNEITEERFPSTTMFGMAI